MPARKDGSAHWSDQEVDEAAFNSGRDKDGRVCGVLMHSSLAFAVEGLRLSSAKF